MIVLNCLFDPRITGATRRVIGVAHAMLDDGIETTVICPETPARAPAVKAAEEVGVGHRQFAFRKPPRPTKPLEVLGYFLNMPRDVMAFRRVIRETKADIVHINGAIFLQPLIAGATTKAKVVWHLNDTMLPGPLAKLFGLLGKTLSSQVVASGQKVAEHYGCPKAAIFYPPVDARRFPSRDVDDWTVTPPVRIGIVGNWNWVKGHDHYVRALAHLKKTHGLAVEGVAVGSILDNQQDYHARVMDEAEQLGVKDDIEIIGFVDNPRDMVATFDMLLMTSSSEACPTCVSEAMAVGVPTVAFEVSGVREQLRHPGCIAGDVVPNGDSEAMAAAIADLAGDPDRHAEYARNGIERIAQAFSIDHAAKAHAAVYRQLSGKT